MGNIRKYTQFVRNNYFTHKIIFRANAGGYIEGKMPCEIADIFNFVIHQKTEILIIVLIKFEYLVSVEDAPSAGFLRRQARRYDHP